MDIDPQRLRDEAYRAIVFTVVIQAHEDAAVRHYCVLRLGEAVGDDVAQDVFVTAWETLSRFRQEGSLRAWLFGIAGNKCLQTFRNRGRRATIAHEFVAAIRTQAHIAPLETPEQTVLAQTQARIDQTQLQRLADCMATLRPTESIVLTLRYSRGLSLREVAAAMGISEAAVRKRLLRIFERFREMMTHDTPG